MYIQRGLHTQAIIAQKLQDKGGSLLERNFSLSLSLISSILPKLTSSSLGTKYHKALQISHMPIVLPNRRFAPRFGSFTMRSLPSPGRNKDVPNVLKHVK